MSEEIQHETPKLRSRISEKTRYEAIFLRNQGLSHRQIANKLNIAYSNVARILKRFTETGDIKDRRRSGRPAVTTQRDERLLIRLMKHDRKLSSNALCHKLNNTSGIKVSSRTVRRILHRNNYMWRSACKKPRLSKKQQKARVAWCNQYKNWPDCKWQNVIFSDEMNVEVDMRKCRVMLRRSPQERFDSNCTLKRTKQGSGSIGIWACMNYAGLGCYRLFEGRLNADRYIEILDNCLLPSIDIFKEENRNIIYQQDGASCHTAKISKQWFVDNQISIMPWPANSPDLNCIENLWSWLDHHLGKIEIINVEQLKTEIRKLLDNVPKEIPQNLVNSMPKRVNQCLNEKGGSTKY
jgi:transposase